MKILSTIVVVFAIKGASALSFRGKSDAIVKSHHESSQRQLTGNNPGGSGVGNGGSGGGNGGSGGGNGMGMMVRQRIFPNYVIGDCQSSTIKAHFYFSNWQGQINTMAPTFKPIKAPTFKPIMASTVKPIKAPTTAPTKAPTTAPTMTPTTAPTMTPTLAPTIATSAPIFASSAPIIETFAPVV